jgi:hypothetical protein
MYWLPWSCRLPVPARRAGAKSAAVLAHCLPQWFQRLEARGFLGRMNTHAFGRAVIHGHEHGHLAFLDGGRQGVVAGPDLVGPLGNDRAGVGILGFRERARRRQQLRFAHQPQHARLRRAHLLETQPRPHFAVAFAMKRRGRQHFTDLPEQRGIAPSGLRSPPPENPVRLRGQSTLVIKAGTRQLPLARHAHHAVAPFREGRSGAAHGFGLRQAKGRSASMR